MRRASSLVFLSLLCVLLGSCHKPELAPPAEHPSFAAGENPARAIIVVEIEGPGGAAVAASAKALETLIAHFDEECHIVSAAEYDAGRLGGYGYAFYLAGKPDAEARASFSAGLGAYEGVAVWVGPGVAELGEATLSELGLTPATGAGEMARTISWTISYGDQTHVEEVRVPAIAARGEAPVLAEARRGRERRPFLAGGGRLWYAATGPALERARFWSSCIWADALHEMLGRAHDGEGRRLVCVLRDVPIWATRPQVPAAIGPMLEAGVPVSVLASMNWGEVPLAERPEAVKGLRAAESMGATVALVTNTRADAQEHFRLAWEVGLHPVAWGGPANGGNPFRLRIASPDGSPPYCAGGLLPSPITISDAGDIARADVERMKMQEVVRDGVALVSFGLWAPPEPFLAFVREQRSAGWEAADLRELGVRVSDARRTMTSGEAMVRVDSSVGVRKRVFGRRWETVSEEVLRASSTGTVTYEVTTPARNVAVMEVLRDKAPRSFVKGVTLDPWAYTGRGLSSKELAERMAERFLHNGVNTVFFYVYNVDEGAAYRTRYRGASVSDWGRKDLLAHMLEACHSRDMKVVAWLYSGRDRSMWQRHPEWRERSRDGRAHNPLRLHAAYFLCPRNPEVRRWYAGLLRDLGRRYPTLDGIELCEPVVNWFGTQACYCDVCKTEFASAWPGEALGGDVWREFRTDGMTGFLSECLRVISEEGIDSYVMTISDALDNGALLSPRRQAEESGFDLEALLDGPYPPDWINFEIIWQQWAAIYGREVFNKEWAGETAQRLVRRTDGRARVVLHVELTDFGSERMTAEDIAGTIEEVREAGPDGIECYHGGAIDRKAAWPVLKRSYRGLP